MAFGFPVFCQNSIIIHVVSQIHFLVKIDNVFWGIIPTKSVEFGVYKRWLIPDSENRMLFLSAFILKY